MVLAPEQVHEGLSEHQYLVFAELVLNLNGIEQQVQLYIAVAGEVLLNQRAHPNVAEEEVGVEVGFTDIEQQLADELLPRFVRLDYELVGQFGEGGLLNGALGKQVEDVLVLEYLFDFYLKGFNFDYTEVTKGLTGLFLGEEVFVQYECPEG